MLTFVSALCLGVSELHQTQSGTLIAFAVHIHVCPYTCCCHFMLEVSPYRCTTFVVLHFQQLHVSLCAFIYWLSTSVCNERIGLLNVHKVVDP